MKVRVGGLDVHYHDEGAGESVILLHGSGPGVSARANWSRTIPAVAAMGYRVIAPDVVGFGESDKPETFEYGADGWAQNLRLFMAEIGVDGAHLVGNSMGGRIALTLAAREPAVVKSLTIMGVRGPETGAEYSNLHKVRAYQPSLENMRELLTLFVSDPSTLPTALVEDRYAASIAPGAQESYRRMFASGAANLMPLTEDDFRALSVPTLILHGRDDRVIPVDCTYQLMGLIPDVMAVVVSQCGHWVQVDRADVFCEQLRMFLTRVRNIDGS